MKPRAPIPASLWILSVLLICGGFITTATEVVAMVREWQNGALYVYIRLDILAIFIGVGLLRRKRAWHKCAIVMTWIGIGALALALMITSFSEAYSSVIVLCVAASIVYAVWALSVLKRKDVLVLYGK